MRVNARLRFMVGIEYTGFNSNFSDRLRWVLMPGSFIDITTYACIEAHVRHVKSNDYSKE